MKTFFFSDSINIVIIYILCFLSILLLLQCVVSLQFAVLAEDAIKAALSDYRIKQQNKNKENTENRNKASNEN